MNTRDVTPVPIPRRTEWLIFTVILLIAAFLRLYRLDAIPPGFTHDEAAHGQDAIAILNGARPVYETIGYGREPLYDYTTALVMALLNRTDYLAVRLTSVLFGLLTLVGTYLVIRQMFNVPVALLTAAMLAVSFWAISTSRQALRSVMLPALLAFAMYFWQRGCRPSSFVLHHSSFILHLSSFILSGVFLAATLWTYMAARATWSLFIIGPALYALLDRERFRRCRRGMLLTLGIGSALSAPMFLWLRAHPGTEQRLSQLGEPLRLLASGNPGEILRNTIEALGMFTFRADTLWLYNIPGRPWLDPITGILFYMGILIALWNWRRPTCLLALAWLFAGMFPSMMTGVVASGTRAVAILPVLYVFPALTIVTLAGWPGDHNQDKTPHWLGLNRRGWGRWVWSITAVLVIIMGAQSFHDYFVVWANARDVRVAYHTTLFEIARYLDRQPQSGIVALSSIYPGRFHDPYTMGMILRRRDLSLRWFDGRSALALPPAGARLIVQALSPVDPALATIASHSAQPVESRLLRPDDLNPRFDILNWNSAQSLTLRALDSPADFGHVIELVGYSMNPAQVKPGDEMIILSLWRIHSATDPNKELVLFTHLLATPQGPILAQQDLLGYPSWQWQPGDEFIQAHRFLVPPGVPPGQYPLEVGVYRRDIPSAVQPNPPTTRLPVYDGDQVIGDRVLLSSVIGDQ